ncbi:MAG TPA: hypothetical protein V6D47_15105 [Oscillatoriaceae cyanobacterium]
MPSVSLRLKALLPPLAVAALLAAGCFYSPTGTNDASTLPGGVDASGTALTGDLYPTPDANGIVTLNYTPPADRTDVNSVQFQFSPPDGSTPTAELDDSFSDGFTATFDATPLQPGLYTVDVFLNDDNAPSAKIPFLVPAGAATDTSSSASGT